jgi:hypothetical protein
LKLGLEGGTGVGGKRQKRRRRKEVKYSVWKNKNKQFLIAC